MAEEATTTSTATTTQPTQPKPIHAGESGGSVSLDAWRRMTGQPELVNEPDPEPEESEEVSDEESSTEETQGEADETKEASDQGEESESEAEAEDEPAAPQKASGKGIKIKTKDGESAIGEDTVILWPVDGEIKEIPLKEHMNIVAGELTVNQRLGKLASYREELKKENAQIKADAKEVADGYDTILKLIDEGKVSAALTTLAERHGGSPVAMYRKMLSELYKAGEAFKDWPEDRIENHFSKLEIEWRDKKEKDRAEKESKQKEVNRFISETEGMIKEQGLTRDDFTVAAELLQKETPDDWKGQTMEQRREATIQQALYTKHVDLISKAINAVNPKLGQDKNFVADLMKVTDPHEWSLEDIEKLIREYLGDKTKSIATTLSKKAAPAATSKKQEVVKQEKKKPTRSYSDFRAAFGLGRSYQ